MNDAGSVGHTMSATDRAKITKGSDFYWIVCVCGEHGGQGATREEALAKHNAHASEKKYSDCGEILREGWCHYHTHPDGGYVCTSCNKFIAFEKFCKYGNCNFN